MHYEQFVCNTYNPKFRLSIAMSGNNKAFVHNEFQMQNLSVKVSGLWWTCPKFGSPNILMHHSAKHTA